VNYDERLHNYSFQNWDPFDYGHRRKVIGKDGLTSRQRRRLIHKDGHQFAAEVLADSLKGTK